MRLKEVDIRRYGPLGGIHWELDEGVQPIYGPNESGKTLIVEALMKMFAGGDAILPEDAKRVDEPPEGYVVVEDGGEERKVTVDEPLCDHLGMDSDELMNTLVVRNTDLRIEEEDQFYERVSDRLSGLWTEGIRKIEDKLKELGRLTGTLKLSDSKGSDKAKSQLKHAKNLKEDIKGYLEEAEEEGLRALEAMKLRAEIEKGRLEKRKDVLELGKLIEAYNKAEIARKELEKIPSSGEISGLREGLGGVKTNIKKRGELERNLSLYKNAALGMGIASAISFVAIVFTKVQSVLGFLFPGLFLVGLLASIILFFKTNSELSASKTDVANLITQARRIGLELESEAKEDRIGSLSEKLGEIEESKQGLSDTLNENLGVLKDNLEIDGEATDNESLERASEILEERRKDLGKEGEIIYDEDELKRVREVYSDTVEELEKLEDDLGEHRDTLRKFLDDAGELDFRTFLGEELELKIVNLEALDQLCERLDDFINKIEKDMGNAETAVKIFEELESEEEERISDLFGEDSETSEIFEKITDGRYIRVGYDKDDGEILVEKSTGEKYYPSSELSGSKGTIDQLYLSIRMALARKILKTDAFFILDDALVFSDKERAGRQHEILGDFSEMGWQTLYLTSDEDIAAKLGDMSGNKALELEEIP